MSLKLNWTNPNVVANSIAIYRGDAELNSATLPSPIVVLTNGETTYIDLTADFGKTYYYMFGTRTANDEVFSANQKILVADNRGVGPSTLKFGDDSLGYYGAVLSADFVAYPDIQSVAAAAIPSYLWNPAWHKFIRNGKVIYVPDSTPNAYFTYQQIYQAGFVYGINANAPDNVSITGFTPTNQMRVIEFKGQRYKVRLMRGLNDNPLDQYLATAITNANHDLFTDPKNNEYNDFMYALQSFVPLLQRTENYVEGTLDSYLGGPYNAGYNNGNLATETARGRIMCQERLVTATSATANVLTRGVRATDYASTPSYSKAHLSQIAERPANVELRWVPVLELIDGTTVTL
jgi:hypothetical protein